MIQENKDLLLQDLCARLPYGVKCIVTKSRTEEGQKGDVGKITCICLEGVDCIGDKPFFSGFGNFKPYLFPLSSMTEEQYEYFTQDLHAYITFNGVVGTQIALDWLNKNLFDYRGFIEKGLALDATGLNIY